MYCRKTMDKEKVVRVLAENYRLCMNTKKNEMAVMCSVILWELIGLRICMSGGGSKVEVYDPKTFRSEWRFNSDTGKEIV